MAINTGNERLNRLSNNNNLFSTQEGGHSLSIKSQRETIALSRQQLSSLQKNIGKIIAEYRGELSKLRPPIDNERIVWLKDAIQSQEHNCELVERQTQELDEYEQLLLKHYGSRTINSLPEELLIEIFSHVMESRVSSLQNKTVLNCRLVCKKWKMLINQNFAKIIQRAQKKIISFPQWIGPRMLIENFVRSGTNLHALWEAIREKLSQSSGRSKVLQMKNCKSIKQWLDTNSEELKKITDIELDDANLKFLSPEIGLFENVKKLDLQCNFLTDLPEEIWQLVKLENLSLTDNKLSSLSQKIGSLTSLKKLDLIGNRLTSLPVEMGDLSNLEELDLGENRLSSLPQEMVKLKQLGSLSIMNNLFTSLPEQIAQMERLDPTQLICLGNPLLFASDELKEKFKQAVVSAMNSFKEAQKYQPLYAYARLYQCVIQALQTKNESSIQKVFSDLSDKDQRLISEKIAQLNASTFKSSLENVESHLFDDPAVLFSAICHVVLEKHDHLDSASEEQLCKLCYELYYTDSSPTTISEDDDRIDLGREILFDNFARFCDLMSNLEGEKKFAENVN